jgi:hypothetical protein
MTKQEVYDKLVQATFDEILPGIVRTEDDLLCRYKDGEKRCAIGLFVQEDGPQPNEGTGWINQSKEFKTWFLNYTGLLPIDAQMLQDTHDNAARQDKDFKKVFIQRINCLRCFQDVNKHGN